MITTQIPQFLAIFGLFGLNLNGSGEQLLSWLPLVQNSFFPGNQPTFIMTQSTSAPVEIRFTEKHPARPPLVNLFFQLKLHNERSEPVWFILPSKLNLSTEPIKNGVDGVQVWQVRGKGRVILGQFQGTGGFQALRLPPKAEITLEKFPIAFWGTLPQGKISIPVILAQTLTVGGESAQAWFGLDPSSDRQASVSFAQAERLSSRHTSDRSEVAVTITGERRLQLQVTIP